MFLPKTRENDPIRLRHMLEWARITERIAEGESRQSLYRNRMLQHALVRTLQVIGEAANNVTAETKNRYQMVPWPDIIGMRHRLVHVYYAIDQDVIWKTATGHVPPLVADLELILEAGGT